MGMGHAAVGGFHALAGTAVDCSLLVQSHSIGHACVSSGLVRLSRIFMVRAWAAPALMPQLFHFWNGMTSDKDVVLVTPEQAASQTRRPALTAQARDAIDVLQAGTKERPVARAKELRDIRSKR
jgi:hypothetical protein